MTILAGSKVDATDFDLPDVVAVAGGSPNSITSASFAVLPTNTCTAAITNPHPTANMLCLVSYGAWMIASTGDGRASLDISGALTVSPGIGGGAAIGWGEILFSTTTTLNQKAATITVALPPGTTTFKMYALRSGAGTVNVNYATIRIVPLSYIF